MKIAEFIPSIKDHVLTFKAFQDGASSYKITCTYDGEIQYADEFSSFDGMAIKWQKIKQAYKLPHEHLTGCASSGYDASPSSCDCRIEV